MKLHLLHDWGKWEWEKDKDGQRVTMKLFDEGCSLPSAIYYSQTKTCKTCNLTKLRRIKI